MIKGKPRILLTLILSTLNMASKRQEKFILKTIRVYGRKISNNTKEYAGKMSLFLIPDP